MLLTNSRLTPAHDKIYGGYETRNTTTIDRILTGMMFRHGCMRSKAVGLANSDDESGVDICYAAVRWLC